MNWTYADIAKSKAGARNPDLKNKLARKKYGNRKTEVGGILFDSKKEAERYRELKMLLDAGAIEDLEMQVEYELNPGGKFSYKYKSDFDYIISDTGEKIVEDVKGFRNKVYLKKRKLMKKVHGITIKES